MSHRTRRSFLVRIVRICIVSSVILIVTFGIVGVLTDTTSVLYQGPRMAIRSYLLTIRSHAELYRARNHTYTGFCTTENARKVRTDVLQQTSYYECNASEHGWHVVAELPRWEKEGQEFFCVDDHGHAATSTRAVFDGSCARPE